MSRILGVLLIYCLISEASLLAQVDSLSNNKLDANVGLGFVYPSRDFSPFYLQNNRWGEFQNEQPTFVFGELSYQHQFGQRLEMSTGFSFRNNIISSHYVQIDYDFLRLNIGRVKNTFGGLRESLSSGSLGQGNNARPIPQVSLEIKDYIDVPFTNGYFETKGHMSHGWLEEDRYISNALLHSKSFYLKLDLEEEIGWSAASGLVHFAQYGGVSPQGDKQLSSFSDFLRVFAGSGIPISGFGTAGEINALGNHLGIVETTITQKIGEHMLTINYQKPFEDFGSLQYISLTDYLFGLEWDLPKVNSLIDKIYLEYIQTKSQGGPGLPDASEFIQTEEDNFGYKFGGRDDIYNNYLYRSGWTYQGQGIGSPLFLTYERTLNFFDAYPDYGVAIANNRIRAIHLGLSGQINPKMGYDGLFTYTQNFGTYAGLYEGRFAWNGVIDDPNFDYVFRPMREQFYTQIKLKYVDAFNTLPVSFQLRLAYDFGDLYNLFGAEFSISYNLIKG
jgi:hypothetical protein